MLIDRDSGQELLRKSQRKGRYGGTGGEQSVIKTAAVTQAMSRYGKSQAGDNDEISLLGRLFSEVAGRCRNAHGAGKKLSACISDEVKGETPPRQTTRKIKGMLRVEGNQGKQVDLMRQGGVQKDIQRAFRLQYGMQQLAQTGRLFSNVLGRESAQPCEHVAPQLRLGKKSVHEINQRPEWSAQKARACALCIPFPCDRSRTCPDPLLYPILNPRYCRPAHRRP